MPKMSKSASIAIDAVEGLLLAPNDQLYAAYVSEYGQSKIGGDVTKDKNQVKVIEKNGQFQDLDRNFKEKREVVRDDRDYELLDNGLATFAANALKMQVNALKNSVRPPGYYMQPVSRVKTAEGLQTTYRRGKAAFTISPTSEYATLIGLIPDETLKRLESPNTSETGKERALRVFVHSLKPMVMILKLVLFPKLQIAKLRKWWRGYANAEENAKLQFALDGQEVREPENYTPDEITMGRLMRQMRALESLINTIGQNNIQKEEYPRCVKCLAPWPESQVGCQINP
jgi:hypothetical protein